MSKHKLGFDATDSDTLAASDFVGAHIYAGGASLSATSGALHVNVQNASIAVTATNLDIRDLAAATDSVSAWTKDGSGNSISSTSNALHVNVQNASLAVTATNLDIRDLTAASDSVQAWAFDGTGNAISSSGGALDVNIASADISFSDIANTAIENTAATVGTSSAALLGSQLSNRKFWFGYNNSNKLVYIGKSGVTTSNGMPQPPGVYVEYRLGPSVSMNAIGAAASLNYRVMELS